MKATEYINNVRNQIKSFIVFEVRNIYLLLKGREPDFRGGENYELDIDGLSVRVNVDNSYLDVDEPTYEDREISRINAEIDGIMYLTDDFGTEIDVDDISTDELAALSNVLENQYLAIVKAHTL